jgi:hypothetical protein
VKPSLIKSDSPNLNDPSILLEISIDGAIGGGRSAGSSSCVGSVWLLVVGNSTCSSPKCECHSSVHPPEDSAPSRDGGMMGSGLGECARTKVRMTGANNSRLVRAPLFSRRDRDDVWHN